MTIPKKKSNMLGGLRFVITAFNHRSAHDRLPNACISIFTWPKKDKYEAHISWNPYLHVAETWFLFLNYFLFNLGVTMPGPDCVTLTRSSGAKDTAHCRNSRNGRRKVARVNQLYCSLDYTDIWSVEPDADRQSTFHSKQAPSPWLTLHHDAFLTLRLRITRVF